MCNSSFSPALIQLIKLYLPAILNIHKWSWSISTVNTRCRRWGEHPVAFCQITIIQLSNRATKTNKPIISHEYIHRGGFIKNEQGGNMLNILMSSSQLLLTVEISRKCSQNFIWEHSFFSHLADAFPKAKSKYKFYFKMSLNNLNTFR